MNRSNDDDVIRTFSGGVNVSVTCFSIYLRNSVSVSQYLSFFPSSVFSLFLSSIAPCFRFHRVFPSLLFPSFPSPHVSLFSFFLFFTSLFHFVSLPPLPSLPSSFRLSNDASCVCQEEKRERGTNQLLPRPSPASGGDSSV